MIDFTMLASLLAPILLLAVFDRVLRRVFARRRPPVVQESTVPAGEVIAPRTQPARAPVETPVAERRVA